MKYSRSYFALSLAMFVIFLFELCSFLIWSGHTLLSTEAYHEWRFFEVLILFSLSVYYFFIPVTELKSKSHIDYLIITILIFGLVSSFQSEYLSRALRDWSLYGSLFFACISLSHIIHKYPKMAFYALIILCSMPIFFIIEFIYQILFYLLLPITEKAPVIYTWTGQFNNPRVFGDTALPILFMIVALLTNVQINNSTIYRRLFQFLLAFLCTIIMFSGGRGIFLSLIISVLFFYFFIPKIRSQLVTLTLYGILCFIIGLSLIHIVGDNINATIARQDSSGRTLLIQQSIEHIKSHTLWGIGPAQFPHYKVPVSHPHNLFIQFMAEWGIIAGLSFAILLLILAYQSFQSSKKSNNLFNIYMCLSVFTFILNCNFNGAHIYPSSQIYGLFGIAFLLSTYIHTPNKNNERIYLINHNLVKLIQFTVAIVLLCTTYLALGCGNIVTSQQFTFGPRFWLYDSIHDDKVCPPAHTFFNK